MQKKFDITSQDLRFPDLNGLFAPKSIVVVGASERVGNLGGDTARRLRKFGFPGPVWAINRTGEPVAGYEAFDSFAALPATPELAIFAIPVSGLMEALESAIGRGVRAGVAYAGGLAEAGGEGVVLQEKLAELCCKNDFVLCGPNCVGTINTAHPLTATFATALHEFESLTPGTISIVSQSGGIATTVLTAIQQAGFGLRHMISSGNEAVITYSDYLHAFAVDEGTEVITGYLEGVRESDCFIRALDEARRRDKPVVLIKAGTTGASARAAQAHTGAMVGEDRIFEAILKEFGVIRVYSVEELVDTAILLAGTRNARSLAGRGMGLVTFGGGNGVLGTDQCAQNGLSVPEISAGGITKLKPLLASVASVANPLDLTPTTAFRPELLAQLPAALDVMAEEPEIDSIMFIVGSLAAKSAEISEVIESFWRRCPKPVLLSWPAPPRGIPEKMAAKGIHTFLDPERGIRAVSRIASRNTGFSRRAPTREERGFDWQAHITEMDNSFVVTEDRCSAILRSAGLSVAPGKLAASASEAVQIARDIGMPVAMKGISTDVTHRAAAGLVALGLNDEAAVEAAFDRMSARSRDNGIGLDGFYVQQMQAKDGELLVAAIRDPMFGVMITCGAGGGLTEVLDDVAIARAPIDEDTAAAMIGSLQVRLRIRDRDGTIPLDKAARFVADFSILAASAPWPSFVFEINPIMVSRSAATAVDGLLLVSER